MIFSAGNGIAHWRGMGEMRRRVPESNPLRPWYLLWGWISLNTWLWSAVFHTRGTFSPLDPCGEASGADLREAGSRTDKPWTEKMDYFSAGASMAYALFYTIVRLWHLYTPLRSPSGRAGSAAVPSASVPLRRLEVLFGLVFASHLAYLSLSKTFDCSSQICPLHLSSTSLSDSRRRSDSYNIVFNAVIGLAWVILWLLFALNLSRFSSSGPSTRSLTSRSPSVRASPLFLPPPYPRSSSPLSHPSSSPPRSLHLHPALTALAFVAAMSLELGDFPPVLGGLVDAHALWHAATIGVVVSWWRFLVRDCLWMETQLEGGSGTGAGE